VVINKKELRTGSINIILSSPVHYKKTALDERIRHCSVYSENLVNILKISSLRITGIKKDTKEPVIFEDVKHPFYVGCMFHPEYTSHPGYPHPLFVKLIQKGLKNKYAR